MKTFFTSDTHYGHGNIIGYCNRPFASRGDMNDRMIEAHNAVVGPEDWVIHVGDFCFGSADYVREVAQRLNGRFILILGNHDRKTAPLKELGWDIRQQTHMTIYESLNWSPAIGVDVVPNPERNVRLFIRHKPEFEETWNANYHLCGHVHTAWKKRESNRRRDPARENIINVGVDMWDFVPRTWEELRDG